MATLLKQLGLMPVAFRLGMIVSRKTALEEIGFWLQQPYQDALHIDM
jgi:hypothetical protein